MEHVELNDRKDERWSSQQVIHQRNSTDLALEQTGSQGTPTERTTRILWDYTVYHRLSTFVIVTNTTIILSFCLMRGLLDDSQTCLQALATNLLTAVLIRQDIVVNLLYHTIGVLPHSTPLSLRCYAANLYHLGGIHSGAAISAGLWLIVLDIAVVRSGTTDIERDARNVLTICLTGLLDILLLQMIILSLPVFRRRYHNTWEGIHRWSGWFLLLIFWLYIGLYFCFQAPTKAEDDISTGKPIYANPVLYILIAMTFANIFPWLYVKRVAPRYKKLSGHAIQLFFDDWYIRPCKTPRFSTSPIMEWHAFAAIPYPGKDGCSVIISRAGDWTSKIIDNPPKYLYTKGHPAQGVLYMARIFKTVLCVGTGSGIAPILGLLDIPGTEFKIIWSTRAPENTYSTEITQRLLRADRGAIILDTSRDGRPDLIELATRIWEAGEIEAVFVISNATVTKDVVKGLRQKGVLAYGPIFDS